ncbi:MAG: hypothetical protein IKN04_01125 [Clostridia bacterium]|nr:hypothetical protein [Clostridia bacterium]
MKKKQLSDNETLFRLDTWMALHQRLCWLILAVLAIGVMAVLLSFRFLPEKIQTAVMFAVMMLLLTLYRWASNAPYRSMRKWGNRLEKGNLEQYRNMLDYVQKLEKALPDALRRQLSHSMTGTKASLMAALGQKEEALELLRNYDQYWDKSQKTNFQAMMNKISGENKETEQKEN